MQKISLVGAAALLAIASASAMLPPPPDVEGKEALPAYRARVAP